MNRQKKDRIIANIMMMAVGACCGLFVVLSADAEKIFGANTATTIIVIVKSFIHIFESHRLLSLFQSIIGASILLFDFNIA